MRMPMTGWYRLNKVNMELTGAAPDIGVPRLPGHIANEGGWLVVGVPVRRPYMVALRAVCGLKARPYEQTP